MFLHPSFAFQQRLPLAVGCWLLAMLVNVGLATVALLPAHAFSIHANDSDVAFLIKTIAKEAGINVIMGDDVKGTLSLDLDKVPALEVLRTVASMSQLAIVPQGHNIYLILPQAKAGSTGALQGQSYWLPLRYAAASTVADLLNQSSGSTGQPLVHPEPRSNALLITGNPQQQQWLTSLAHRLDVPLQQRVYQLSYSNPVAVAEKLKALLFQSASNEGAGGSNSIDALKDALQEGSGINTVTGGSGGGSSSSASSSSSSSGGEASGSGGSSGRSGGGSVGSLPNGISVRNEVATPTAVEIPSQGIKLIPDTRVGQLVVQATEQQFQQIEAALPWLDAKPAQVAIEAAMIEVSLNDLKNVGLNYQYNEGGKWSFLNFDFKNKVSAIPAAGYSSTGGYAEGLKLQMNMLMQTGKAKSISNPTVVATHNTETVISIVDDILRGQTFTPSAGQFFGQSSPVIGQAGVVLDILPKIGAAGQVTLRVRPSITSVYNTVTSGSSTIQLVRSRDLLAQSVSVKDGESLLLGGLIDTRNSRTQNRTPLLSDLPIAGALFRVSNDTMSRNELVIMITPHVLNALQPTPVHRLKMVVLEGGR